MTPLELKNSILQLAIQGKLVEQRDNEGTGSKLFEKITAERKTLGLKPNKHLQAIDEDDCLFEIPDTWKWVRFGSVVDYKMGKTPPRAELEWWKSEVPWVSIADMSENGHINTTKERVSRKAIELKFGNRISRAGTLLMSFKLTVGKVSILDIDAVHNEAIISVFPNGDEDGIFQSFLFYFLPYISNTGETKDAIKGRTLNDFSICNLLIPLPPLEEQRRIVAKIEELLPLVEQYEKAYNRLEQLNKQFPDDMKKSILQLAIQGKLVEQRPEEGTGEELYKQIQAEKAKLIKEGKIKKEKPLPPISEDEISFEIPDSWKPVRLGMIASVLGGKRIPAGRTLQNENNGHVYIRVSDMKNGSVQLTGLKYVPDDIYPLICRYIINKEDLYITVAGTIGDVGIVPECLDGANLTENADRLVFSIMNQKWFYYALQSFSIKDQIADATTKVGQPKLAIKRIEELILFLPPILEQKRIVAKIEELLPLCDLLNRKWT